MKHLAKMGQYNEFQVTEQLLIFKPEIVNFESEIS